MTSKFKGYSSYKVLKIAQALYEQKHITYPRTSSRFLNESQVNDVSNVVDKIKKLFSSDLGIVFAKTKDVFDGSKVDSHPAIIQCILFLEKRSWP